MGSISMVVAVLDIHIDKKAEETIRPSRTLKELPPKVFNIFSAILR